MSTNRFRKKDLAYLITIQRYTSFRRFFVGIRPLVPYMLLPSRISHCSAAVVLRNEQTILLGLIYSTLSKLTIALIYMDVRCLKYIG